MSAAQLTLDQAPLEAVADVPADTVRSASKLRTRWPLGRILVRGLSLIAFVAF